MNHNDYVNKQVNQKNFFIKKKFSQNFLLDENIIKKIVKSADINKDSYVIEIGPGFGALTKYLVDQSKKVLLYEIDDDLIPHLQTLFKDKDNIHIEHQDFLKVQSVDQDIDRYLDQANNVIVISNLPYHITTPIIMKILEESQKIKRLVLMMQLEVAQRLTSKPNTKDYNALSIIIQDQSEAKYMFKVPKTVFQPRPNVDSAVIRLDRYLEKERDPLFYQFVHECFSQRRKTLVNNLHSSFSINKDDIKVLLDKLEINDKIRAEALDLEMIKNLYKLFKEEDLI
ncbi:ribosomal RNA small subunit methyltransferase A [Hujiaoplasma nucleasis]|uniref:Ribosomal RNA small subunit methyltransferase A n=1 Tax=Hujiaoplasma nucleasis TaxID=2725268 RepID=A0A7L6N4Q0_9MOLU|nr:16S rRNA (adenine(1518)-N(6)/adenine(1519)-N(6))-dimethyltransferase RsmA [Hujiaoplasma nucleasis]QLY40472.1 ribosomal RNA small subunit methyltransferase A [Hujiaoplasma nucleasis]